MEWNKKNREKFVNILEDLRPLDLGMQGLYTYPFIYEHEYNRLAVLNDKVLLVNTWQKDFNDDFTFLCDLANRKSIWMEKVCVDGMMNEKDYRLTIGRLNGYT